MGIKYGKTTARLIDFVSVEEAEALFEWLQASPRRKLDLSQCTHLHAANLQVLMATGVTISKWPNDADLHAWLSSALGPR
jgi:hypothetical protein